MNYGLAFQIFNRPVKNDQIWDIRIFWRLVEYNGLDVVNESQGFTGLETCLDNILDWIQYREQVITKKWKGPETRLIDKKGISNLECWDWVVTKDNKIMQIDSDDQYDLPYSRIDRFATKGEANNAEEINKLVEELIKVEKSNTSSWEMYGSELCAGSMIGEENAIENKIKELRCQN